MPLSSVTRRAVLGSASLGGIALGAGGLTDLSLAAPQGLQGSLPKRVDAVVVGAGLSGLMAARRIAAHGRSVLVVEARDRVGGRILNHHLRSGGVIEAGGAFVGPTQNHILQLAKQLKVPTFKEYVTGKNVYVSELLGRVRYGGTIPPDPTILLDAGLLIAKVDEYAAQIDVAAPWKHPRAKQWDAMTLADFIRSEAVLNPGGLSNLIESWTQPTFGADPARLSLLFVLWYVACSGNESTVGEFARSSDTVDGAQERRFVGGSQLIPLRMARQLGDRVALRAPVRRIDQTGDRVKVHTARGVVEAREVVVAVPPPLVLDIDWSPGLPEQRRRLMRAAGMGRLMKCDAVYKTPFWRKDGLTGFGINERGAARVVFDNSPKDGTPGVLLAFVGGSTWHRYGRLPRAERRRAVLEGFAELFGERALHPIEYTEQDWTREQWTAGGPTAIHGPGELTAYGPAIRRRFRHVHWAGTETSTYWTGYMDGAVRAGKRAAAEVLEALR